MYKYQAIQVRGEPEKFDLVSTENALDRKWELGALTVQEANEWRSALNKMHAFEAQRRGGGSAACLGAATVVHSEE